jgi:hypothetical protein
MPTEAEQCSWPSLPRRCQSYHLERKIPTMAVFASRPLANPAGGSSCFPAWSLEVRTLKAEVACSSCSASSLVQRDLAEGHAGCPLPPASRRLHGDGCQAVWKSANSRPAGGGRKPGSFPRDLRCGMPPGGQHGHAPVFDLCLPALLEVLHPAICGEARRIPEANRVPHA